MKKFLHLCCLLSTLSLFGQELSKGWEAIYNGEKNSTFNDIISTSYGFAVGVGTVQTKISSKEQAFFMKIRADGKIIGKRRTLGLESEVGTPIALAVTETADGKFIVVGYTKTQRGWATVVDKYGNEVVNNVFEGFQFEKKTRINDVVVTPNNEIILVGNYQKKPCIWKVNGLEKGANRFRKTTWRSSQELINIQKIITTQNGNFAIAGEAKEKVIFQVFSIDYTSKDTIQYITSRHLREFSHVTALLQTAAGNFVMAGYQTGYRDRIALVIYQKERFKKMNRKIIFESQKDIRVTDVVELYNQNLVITGFGNAYDPIAPLPKSFITVVTQKGKFLEPDPVKWWWNGGENDDRIWSMTKLKEGALIAVGNTKSKQREEKNKGLWAFKIKYLVDIGNIPFSWYYPMIPISETYRSIYPLQFNFRTLPKNIQIYRNGKIIPFTTPTQIATDTTFGINPTTYELDRSIIERILYTYTTEIPLLKDKKNHLHVVATFDDEIITYPTRVIENKSLIQSTADTSMSTTPDSKERRIALLIGNSAYEIVDKLRTPSYDVDSLENVLKLLDFEVWKLKDLTKDSMLTVLQTFQDTLSNYDARLCYYAGHGFQENNINYLLPIDGDLTDIEESITLNKLIEVMNGKPKNSTKVVNIMILDACRVNPRVAQRLGEGKIKLNQLQKGLAGERAIDDIYLAFSTSAGKFAFDSIGSDGNSPYVKALLKCLRAKNTKVIEVFQAVRLEMERIFIGKEQKQRPEVTFESLLNTDENFKFN